MKKAYEYSKKFQNSTELQMDYKHWLKYVRKTGVFWNQNMFIEETQVGTALVKSGMGIKNIDCYLHSGEMEDIYVDYKTNGEGAQNDYNVMLYKSINTSYPLSSNLPEPGLHGYRFKNRPNYVIRFSDDGFMQVTKPDMVRNALSGRSIRLDYSEGHNVKNLSSDEITKLILD
jgi:hypothetical protein